MPIERPTTPTAKEAPREEPGLDQFEAINALSKNAIPQESPEACEQKVAELESLMEDFEERYNLELLRSITYITADERRTHPMRSLAKVDLENLFGRLFHLEEQDAVSDETITRLWDQYEPLTMAFGNVKALEGNNEFIEHDRRMTRIRGKH